MKRHQIASALSGALAVLLLLPPLSGCGPKSGTPASAQDTTGETAPVAAASAPASGETEASSGSSTSLSKTNLQMALGNPDHATTSASNSAHYLLRRSQYALSYNDGLRFPNWVSWHLTKADIGSEPRGAFFPDPDLPTSFTKITPSDYTGSGYDRGHNCPAKDRSANPTDSKAVFLMSNMTPQQHGMNAGPWEQLESYSRDLTGENELFVTCGHGFSDKKRKTIGTDKIAVPDFGWKIIVVVPKGSGNPVSRITPTTRVIAVRMPNISTIIRNDWRQYRTSVADIEAATGLTFFDALPKATAAALKDRVDFDMSAPPKAKRGETSKPPKEADTPPGPTTNATGQVWVNTKSKAYWRPGTEHYGKTKQGKYMTEADAIKAGYHAAGGSKSVPDKTNQTDPQPDKSDNPLAALRSAAKGLLFMSESDKPVKAFLWKADEKSGDKTKSTPSSAPISESALKTYAKIPDGATVKTLTVEEFFKPATEKQDWFGPEETATAERFQALMDVLQKNLTDTKAFRVENSVPDDSSLIDVYVVGKTTGGDWAGVSTQLVET